ncbi:MAG: DNA methyltransferase [Cyanobacteria bacterium P01_H01_bin.74]
MSTSSPRNPEKKSQDLISVSQRSKLASSKGPCAKNRPKVLDYNDIDLASWRDYPDIETDSLWLFSGRSRNNGHQLDYHGNCIPQILTQLLQRYTKAGDTVLDMFLGSGTSAIEALNMNRKAIGIELNPEMVKAVESKIKKQFSKKQASQAQLIVGNSADDQTIRRPIEGALRKNNHQHAQFLFLHPPYDDIISFSDSDKDLSNAGNTDAFLSAFKQVCQTGYDLLAPGRFATLVIGDKYHAGQLIPLGFYCMQQLNAVGFVNKSIIVKNITGNEKGKGKTGNLWRYRALRGGFYIFKHEYIFVFQKPA